MWNRGRRRRMAGMGGLEYALITGMMVTTLLVPFTLEDENEAQSVMRRIIDAVQYEHSGYMYVAGLPALPRSDGWLSGEDPEDAGGPEGGGGGAGGDGLDPNGPDDIGGVGMPPVDGGGVGGVGDGVGGGELPDGSGGGNAPGSPGIPPVVGPPGGPPGDGGLPGGPGGDVPGVPEPPIVGAPGAPGTGQPGPGGIPGVGGPGGIPSPDTPLGDGLWPGDEGYGNGSPAHCNAGPGGGLPHTPLYNGPEQNQQFMAQRWSGVAQSSGMPSTHVGNPIHVVTGNKYQQETDLGLLPHGLSFVRHYNSRTTYNASMGYGWRHGFDVTLQDRGSKVVIWQADGRRIDFTFSHRDRHGVRHYRARQHQDGHLTRGDFYRWSWSNGGEVVFLGDGRLYSQTDPAGRRLGFDHDEYGRLAAVVDADNRAVGFQYDSAGRLSSMTDPAGRLFQYEYGASGNLTRVSYPDGTARIYHYEDPHDSHNLTGTSVLTLSPLAGEGRGEGEKLERLTTWAYDDKDRGILSRNANDTGRVTLDYRDVETHVTDSAGGVSVYRTENARGIPMVTAIYGPGCSTCGPGDVTYNYNERLQITRLTKRDGSATAYRYDALGRLTSLWRYTDEGEAVELAGFEYHDDSDKVTQMRRPSVNPVGWRRIAVEYDDDKPVSATESGYAPTADGEFVPVSRSQSFNYDPRGRLLGVDGYREDVEDLLRISGEGTTLFPDGGSLQVLAEDSYGRPARISVDETSELRIAYNRLGRIEKIENGNGLMTFAYSANNSLAGLEVNGRLINWPAQQNRREPDRVAGQTPPLSRPSPVILVTDPAGNTTRYGVDDFGRTVFADSPDSGLTRYRYDPAGNPVSVTDANGVTARFSYDLTNRVVNAVAGDEQLLISLPGRTGPGGVQSAHYSEATESTEHGRRDQTVKRVGNWQFSLVHSRDTQGRLREKVLPDGRTLVYDYHRDGPNTGRLAGIFLKRALLPDLPLLTGLNDEPPGSNVIDWQSPNGINTVLRRRGGRLAGLRIGLLHDLDYHHDQNGRIVGIDDHGRIDQRYRFDHRGQLDFALTPQALYGYRYDDNGNRTRRIINGRHMAFGYEEGSNRLANLIPSSSVWHPPMLAEISTAITSVHSKQDRLSVSLNPRGDIENLGDLRIEYTANGQPEHVYRGNQLLATYRYNHRAERISKTTYPVAYSLSTEERVRGEGSKTAPLSTENTTYFLYENRKLTTEINDSGEVTRQYLYLGHHPAVILEEGEIYAVHTNHLGAPIAVTDADQQLIWQARYAPFGKGFVDEDPDGDGAAFTLNLRLPGQYEDIETGLHYNYHRYYDPVTARYISSDPLGLRAGPNTYAYVANDPMNNIDPLGLLLFAFDGTGNNDPSEGKSDVSNVVKFRDAYQSLDEYPTPHGNNHYYISGPGTTDSGSGISGGEYDAAFGLSLTDRVAKMGDYFIDHLNWLEHNRVSNTRLNIDIVGFSRGATAARVFANLLEGFLKGEEYFDLDGHDKSKRYFYSGENGDRAWSYMFDGCVVVNLRFLGLWDTVPHYGGKQSDDLEELQLDIPTGEFQVDIAAHAVSVNENRDAFNAVSIHDKDSSRNSSNRIEKGFLGAHADIGGGYPEGDLSDIALMWMIKNATGLDHTMIDSEILFRNDWNEVSNPVVHDNLFTGSRWYIPDAFLYPSRDFVYKSDEPVQQQDWGGKRKVVLRDPLGKGLNYSTSIDYFDDSYMETKTICNGTACTSVEKGQKGKDKEGFRTKVGLVKVDGVDNYQNWLSVHYDLNIPISHDGVD